MSLTYSRYLEIDGLLSLQRPRSLDPRTERPEHDEMLFIVVHQVYELWFRQVLHELDHLRDEMSAHRPEVHDGIPRVRRTLKRILTILKTMVAQVDIVETMTPISFNSFRDRLETASGFQSPQFREVEFVLGNRSAAMLEHHRENPAAFERLRSRLDEPTLYQSFLGMLAACGFPVPKAVLESPAKGAPLSVPEIRPALVEIYRGHDRLSGICELLVDLDEGLQEWRYRHVKMVERTIGSKPGTGGSSGVEYLRSTLFRPVFPDLWAIRGDL